MFKRNLVYGATLLVLCAAGGCRDADEPLAPSLNTSAPRAVSAQVTPDPLVPVEALGMSLTLWPYTGSDLAGKKVDPINFLFPGRPDPRQIRALLLSLDGNRPGVPFNCLWKDAAGGSNQTAFAEGAGWVGSSIQLTCGGYDVRFHLRLFSVGNWTLGAAHFEVNITGTQEHESLSWNVARDFVAYDFMRSGKVSGYAPVFVGSQTPTYRTIRQQVWDGIKNTPLAGLVQPVIDDSVHIPNDGAAVALTFSSTPAITPMDETTSFDVTMDQYIPKPFCGGPADYVHVSGLLHVTEHTVVGQDLSYHNTQQMKGDLVVKPVLATGLGPAYKAMIDNVNTSLFTDSQNIVTLYTRQATSPAGNGGVYTEDLKVGPASSTGYSLNVRCD